MHQENATKTFNRKVLKWLLATFRKSFNARKMTKSALSMGQTNITCLWYTRISCLKNFSDTFYARDQSLGFFKNKNSPKGTRRAYGSRQNIAVAIGNKVKFQKTIFNSSIYYQMFHENKYGDLHSVTIGSRFESGRQVCAEVSSLQ